MNFKVNFKPYPGATYFTFQEHQRTFDAKIHKYADEYIAQTEKDLVHLFNISPEFRFEIYEKNKLGKLLSQVENLVVKDDPISGLDNMIGGKHLKNEIVMLDLSYSFPRIEHDFTSYDSILIDPVASLGIPI